MKKQFQVRQLIDKPFNRADYLRFIKTLFEINLESQYLDVSGKYTEYIKSGEYLGEYESNREQLHLYIINLQNKSVERARVFQRDFIARDLQNHGAENALVVFHNDNQWRVSFVKREKVEGKEQRLSAKRYSFYVGEDEINNTCVQRINLLLKKEKPSIGDIEDAFSVEKVKDEFFKEYKGLFDKLYKEVLRLRSNDRLIDEEFTEKNISEEDFAKKILGQIVFLYFLQKKGWLGIERDSVTKKFGEFGEGRRDFLQHLFNLAIKEKKNFFNAYLEELFYNALANSGRKADDYKFNLEGREWKIPFLNGGLFEPIGEYDWGRTDIKIDDNIFREILETFNKYNFTVREDEPMEKEVAIDPEMLGKVFENLLETKERKSTGSFYTPREIVHYMCQQSLINYLETNSSIKRDIIERFVTEDCSLDIPKEIKQNSVIIDKLLKDIKVVDPAVGSGAFLVGMMTEIVKARSCINPDKKIFDLKEECIENNLHGVDIAPGAVDICQLRLWLSLVVDEENYGDVKPLPNLDYKIMCGNSLIEDYKGMKLWDDKWIGITSHKTTKNKKLEKLDNQIRLKAMELREFSNNKEEKEIIEQEMKKLKKDKEKLARSSEDKDDILFKSDSQRKLEILRGLHKKFTHISDRAEKMEMKKRIEEAVINLIRAKLIEEKNEDALKEVEDILHKKRSQPFFLWKMNFIDVFQRENPGFDVVIANPPYVDSEEMVKNMKDQRDIIAKKYSTAKGNWDLYIPFFELAFILVREKGILSFITPNKWLSIGYGKELRNYFSDNIYALGNCDKIKVFEAGNTPEISFIKKEKLILPVSLDTFQKDYNITRNKKLPRKLFEDDNWGIVLSENLDCLLKIIKVGKRIEDYCNPENPFTVSEAYILKECIFEGNNKKLKDFKLINTGTIDPYISLWGYSKTSYIKNKYERPYISKEKFKQLLPKRFEQSKSPKLIFSGIRYFECYFDLVGEYVAGKSTVILREGKSKLSLYPLLCLFNSKLIRFFIKEAYSATGIGGGVNYTVPMIKKLPIPKIMKNEMKILSDYAIKILNITKNDDYLINDSKKEKVNEIEKEIDQMVYKLYDLTPEEIKIVNGF